MENSILGWAAECGAFRYVKAKVEGGISLRREPFGALLKSAVFGHCTFPARNELLLNNMGQRIEMIKFLLKHAANRDQSSLDDLRRGRAASENIMYAGYWDIVEEILSGRIRTHFAERERKRSHWRCCCLTSN